MGKSTDVRVVATSLHFLEVKNRIPLKFGPETTTEVTCARVRVRVADRNGRTAEGWGETPLNVQWVWPSSLPYAVRHERLKAFCCRLAEAWASFPEAGHPVEVGYDFKEHRLADLRAEADRATGGEGMPTLAALVCCSLFDIALHDAYGQLLGRPVYETYTAEHMNRDLAAFLTPAAGTRVSFTGKYPKDFLVFAPLPQVRAWHLVGGLDLLDASERTGKEPDDGYPVVLPDWIRRADPESKVFGVSRKDRGAILLGGQQANAAFWYDEKTGEFVTSRFYSQTYPEWIRDFTRDFTPARKFGTLWTPLPVTEAAQRAAGIEAANCASTFPHAIGGLIFTPDAAYFQAFGGTPYMDEYLGQFAQRLVAQEKLGQDDHLDFLGISFSAVDSVGHAYGPNSPETLDAFMRLDQTLGALFRYLDENVGLDRVVVSLAADHGVMGLPEYQKGKHLPGSRVTMEDVVCLQAIGAKLEEKFGKGSWLLDDLYLNYDSLKKNNLSQEQVERELSGWLARCPSVSRVWTRADLLSPPANPDPFMVRYLHSFNPERSPDLFIQYKENVLPHFGPGTGHGSPYDYDRHIPFLLIVPGQQAGVVDQEISSVDIAPTVATVLGIKPDRKLDGVDRTGLLQRQRSVVSSR